MRKEDCLFCKIVAGEIPSAKVYEDDRVLAFEDVNPQMPVHTLIVPKNHYDNIGDGIPDDEMGYLFNTVKKIAELKGIAETAATLVFGERRAAGRYRPPFARGAFRRHLRIYALGIPKEAGR